MEYQLHGTVMQTVNVLLQAGESVYTESGGMAWMSENISMETGMRGGVMAAIGRKLAGESMFLTTYSCTGGQGLIAFAAEFPGKIIPLHLEPGQSIVCQKNSFMAAESSVALEMHFHRKLGAGLFGGEGFILQRLTGPGVAWTEIDGEVTEYDLQAGQGLKVDAGHVAMFEPTVSFDIVTVKGVKNVVFGGEGLFLANLRGPGRVWLQSMPVQNMARRLIPFLPQRSS